MHDAVRVAVAGRVGREVTAVYPQLVPPLLDLARRVLGGQRRVARVWSCVTVTVEVYGPSDRVVLPASIPPSAGVTRRRQFACHDDRPHGQITCPLRRSQSATAGARCPVIRGAGIMRDGRWRGTGGGGQSKGPHPLGAALCEGCPAASYSPTLSRVQYHRRWWA